MEIVFTEKKYDLFEDNKITGFYGDILDLLDLGIDVEGIEYDDEWTVKRFLNGVTLKLNDRITDIFKYLDLDKDILNKKIKILNKTNFKFVLLAKLLLINKNIIIFDYFDTGLNYTDRKRLIKIIKALKSDGKTIVVISNNLVFLNQVVDSIIVYNDDEIVYNGQMSGVFDLSICDEEKILKFIKMANKKGAKLDNTLDSSELLKDIYRSVY